MLLPPAGRLAHSLNSFNIKCYLPVSVPPQSTPGRHSFKVLTQKWGEETSNEMILIQCHKFKADALCLLAEKRPLVSYEKKRDFWHSTLKKVIITHILNTVLARRGNKAWHGREWHVYFPAKRCCPAERISSTKEGWNKRCEKPHSEDECSVPLQWQLCVFLTEDGNTAQREHQCSLPTPEFLHKFWKNL